MLAAWGTVKGAFAGLFQRLCERGKGRKRAVEGDTWRLFESCSIRTRAKRGLCRLSLSLSKLPLNQTGFLPIKKEKDVKFAVN